MSEQVIRLTVDDYEPLIAFLSRAFNHHPSDWFALNLGAIYRPTDALMRCNFAVKKNGRIVGNVGLFPFEINIGGHTFRVAGIGGVSTDPDERRTGLMKLIMDTVMAEIQREKYPITWLSGQRQRYRYWGYERAGCCLRAVINGSNVRHEPLWQQSVPLKIEPITGPGELLQAAMELHARQPYHRVRPPEYFLDHLRQWSGRPVAARTEGGTGKVVAYAIQSAGGPNVDELVAADVPSGLGLLRSLNERDGTLTVTLNGARDPLAQAIVSMAESARVEETGNWQINDWPAVVGALIEFQAEYTTLADGEVTLGINGLPQSLRISVEDHRPHCGWINDQPDLHVDAPTATRLLFGPLRPSQVMPLPAEACVLDQWCPLPLYLGKQDGV